MTPLEEIETAIEKLGRLRDKGISAGDRWTRRGSRIAFEDNGQWFSIVAQDNWGNADDMDLIVTLHATIDAQLAFLRDDLEICKRNGWIPNPFGLTLARAINGGA